MARPVGDPTNEPTTDPAFEAAFLDCRDDLAAMARRTLGNTHQAEEAVQETFARAWRSRERFDGSLGSFRAWLFSIERNLLIDMARSRRRQSDRDTRLGREPEQLADEIGSAVVSWQVEEAMSRLTADHRKVVVEVYYRGRTSREAAVCLGIPEGTVRSRLFYALKALKVALDELGWEW